MYTWKKPLICNGKNLLLRNIWKPQQWIIDSRKCDSELGEQWLNEGTKKFRRTNYTIEPSIRIGTILTNM